MAQPLQETHRNNDSQKETIDKIVTQVGFLMLVLHCLDFLFAVILSLTFLCNLQHDVLCQAPILLADISLFQSKGFHLFGCCLLRLQMLCSCGGDTSTDYFLCR